MVLTKDLWCLHISHPQRVRDWLLIMRVISKGEKQLVHNARLKLLKASYHDHSLRYSRRDSSNLLVLCLVLK